MSLLAPSGPIFVLLLLLTPQKAADACQTHHLDSFVLQPVTRQVGGERTGTCIFFPVLPLPGLSGRGCALPLVPASRQLSSQTALGVLFVSVSLCISESVPSPCLHAVSFRHTFRPDGSLVSLSVDSHHPCDSLIQLTSNALPSHT